MLRRLVIPMYRDAAEADGSGICFPGKAIAVLLAYTTAGVGGIRGAVTIAWGFTLIAGFAKPGLAQLRQRWHLVRHLVASRVSAQLSSAEPSSFVRVSQSGLGALHSAG